MPLLFYGTLDLSRRRLYAPGPRLIETSVFDSFKIRDLAPYDDRRYVANFWWFRCKKHSAFAWHDKEGQEQTLFVPALMNWREALIIARDNFGEIVPSAVFFRLNNYKRPYTYD